MNLPALQPEQFRYTRYFCEENIWWLARSLLDDGRITETSRVWLITNPSESILLFNQLAARPGQAVTWDYHVILLADPAGSATILDFDTRLGFAIPQDDYLHATFPVQSALPEHYRAWVRSIPVLGYLEHFGSDRSHMRGHLPPDEYPDYPCIQPADETAMISLARYRDLEADLRDGSRVGPLSALYPGLA